jgi:chromate reductase, NAD(P)H dehydrogenase (quinone)
MRVLAFAGSTRPESWNKKLIRLAEAELHRLGVSIDHFELTADAVPVFLDDLVTGGKIPPPVLDLKERVRRADGVLIATPEYDYSVPGPLKNLLDWLSRPPKDNPFKGKLVGQLGASPGPGGTLQAQNALRHVVGVALFAWVLPGPACTFARVEDLMGSDGAFKGEAEKKKLAAYVERFVEELK